MPWPESWPIRGGDVAFADSAATRKEAASSRLHIGRAAFGGLPTDVESFLVAAESANAISSPLIGHDSGHGVSDMCHRSGQASNCSATRW